MIDCGYSVTFSSVSVQFRDEISESGEPFYFDRLFIFRLMHVFIRVTNLTDFARLFELVF